MAENFNILNYSNNIPSDKVLLYYKGPFEEEMLFMVGSHLKNFFKEEPRMERKVFSTFVELAQNISLYSSEKNFFADENLTNGIGSIVVQDLDDQLKITAANLIKSSQVDEIVSKAEKVNSLTKEELREWKREILKQPYVETNEHKGGGIGLLEIALRSGSVIDIDITNVDEESSFISLSVYFKKISQKTPASQNTENN